MNSEEELRRAETLSAERWAQVREVLEAALELDAGNRAEFLAQACGSDEPLRSEVEALLHGLERSPAFLQEPVSRLSGGPADPLLGAAVGPWRLLRRIGDGGTASVYAAARGDHEFRKIVAVKIIKSGMDFEEILSRFRTERQILAGLDHPNITRLLDGGSTESGLPYLVMEYVEGLPITQYSTTHQLSIGERLELFRAVCSALAYAHQSLIVHRDLKPANILVTAQGVPKVLDFGIAKLLRPESSGYTAPFTRTQMRMMTPEYASPEQVRGDPITTASDIYSLGVVLYELLTGRRPYRIKTTAEIEQAICESEPERPSTAATRAGDGSSGRRLRGDLDAIILTALRKEPQRRYLTVDRLSDDIRRHLVGLPVSASKDTWAYRARKFVVRHKAGVAVTGLAAMVLLGATAFSTYLLRQEQNERKVTFELVEFMLTDLDKAMQSGATSARKTLIDGVLARLPRLSSGHVRDPDLRSLLFTAYLKLGDLQGNMFTNNLGDLAAVKQSYQRAREFASQPDEIAKAELRLGDAALNGANFVDAMASYQRAAPILDAAVQKSPRQRELYAPAVTNWYRIGLAQSQTGRLRDALASYEHEFSLAEQQLNYFPDSRRELGMAHQHAGDALVQLGNPSAALSRIERSLEIYQQLREANPNNANLRRLEAEAYVTRAEAFGKLGQWRQAAEMYQNGLTEIDALRSRDPNNGRYQADRNRVLPLLSEVEYKLGRTREARELAVAALAGVRPLIDRPQPSPFDLYQYCYDLVTTPFPDLHQPQTALHWAQEAAHLTGSSIPGILDLQARAWDENGNLEEAIRAERRALALYPAAEEVTPGTERAEMKQRLAAFERRRDSHATAAEPVPAH